MSHFASRSVCKSYVFIQTKRHHFTHPRWPHILHYLIAAYPEPWTSIITCYHWYRSPVGNLLLAGDDDALTHISFPKRDLIGGGTAGGKFAPQPYWQQDENAFTHTRTQLKLYFSGQLTAFDLLLKPQGTDFQQLVWQALVNIPYGETVSYRAIADSIDRPNAVRAVGNANGRNPIPIVIPCHRVIGKDGSLTGFGGGLPVKRFLLDLENCNQLTLAL